MELKPLALGGFTNVRNLFMKDLEALPDDAFTTSFGPACRAVADIVYEVNLVNDHVGIVIRGEEAFPWPDEGWIKAPKDFRTKAAVVAGYKASTDKIIATIEGFSEADLEGKLQTEQGETTRYQRCQFMMIHTWYHLGQLNFVQTLLGDTEWHWS
ncbi:MAG TPA: DinB family protein [Fimbriimonadaceae bacterium]|nr:DinB family protein [Fimbriimonadaceae bacterium]